MEARTILMCEANEHVADSLHSESTVRATPPPLDRLQAGGRPCQVAADAVNRFPITSISSWVAVVGRAKLPGGGWSRTRTRSGRYRLGFASLDVWADRHGSNISA